MTIYIGADHRGFELKKELIEWLKEKYQVIDCGNTEKDPNDDYPDFAFAVGDRVAFDMEGRGIVICGSGAGVAMAANKVQLIRCAQAVTDAQVKSARNDDDINVLAIGCDLHSKDEIKTFITSFLDTPYKAELRFDRRIQKIQIREMSLGGGCGGGCGDGSCSC